MTEVIITYVPWSSLFWAAALGWGLSVLFRWLRRNA